MPQNKDEIIDISGWYTDDRAYAEGTLTKSTLFSPDVDEFGFIVRNHRYLFKQGREDRSPWQYWSEIVAYKVGCYIQVKVPPAFAAVNSDTGEEGSLIEWFYNYPDSPRSRYTPAEQWFMRVNPKFDTKKGVAHNLEDAEVICRTFMRANFIGDDWKKSLLKYFTLDALIGNVDRHQNNWGFIWATDKDDFRAQFSPAFDNGSSLGYEIIDRKLCNFEDSERIRAYIAKGQHHMRLSRSAGGRPTHFELIEKFLTRYRRDNALVSIVERAIDLRFDELSAELYALCDYDMPTRLSEKRVSFMLRLIEARIGMLRPLLDQL